MWWDETIERWHGEGLPPELTDVFEIHEYFGLDPYKQFWFSTTDPTIEATQHHVEGIVSAMDDYLAHRPNLFPDHSDAIQGMKPWFERQDRGDAVIWITLEGFFWFPRTVHLQTGNPQLLSTTIQNFNPGKARRKKNGEQSLSWCVVACDWRSGGG